MPVPRHPTRPAGSTYLPSILVDKCTPGRPWGVPASPSPSPRATHRPVATSTLDRYETETLNPGAGSKVTVIIPATVPAKLTRPDAGAMTTAPAGEA
jgi:hypothetical protein